MNLYNDYSAYLKSKYGCRVYRIALDAGFTCPNRDGTKGYGGCIYCGNDGSRSNYTNPRANIKEQLSSRIGHLKKTKNAVKFIAYFQAFTNTYASADKLKTIYDSILCFDEVVGMSIGTRPDTVDAAKLKILSSYKDRYEVWIEYGLQSAHDKTLKNINRGHTFEDFASGVKLAKEFGIPVCAHVILGLPGETKEDMRYTAGIVSELKIDAIKIHLLHILKGSPLEKSYNAGDLTLMTQPEYVEITCDFLERLSPGIIIQRLTGEGDRSSHVAPAWAMDKIGTINKISEVLKERGSCQGFLFKEPISSSRA